MAKIDHVYGSECHLLRYLGRHRRILDQRVLEATGGQAIEWIDYHFDSSRKWWDGERKALDCALARRTAGAKRWRR